MINYYENLIETLENIEGVTVHRGREFGCQGEYMMPITMGETHYIAHQLEDGKVALRPHQGELPPLTVEPLEEGDNDYDTLVEILQETEGVRIDLDEEFGFQGELNMPFSVGGKNFILCRERADCATLIREYN